MIDFTITQKQLEELVENAKREYEKEFADAPVSKAEDVEKRVGLLYGKSNIYNDLEKIPRGIREVIEAAKVQEDES